MIVTGSEQETIDQWRRWGDLAVAHRRQAQECSHLAVATLQGYANVKAQAAGALPGRIYRAADSALWQVTGVFSEINPNGGSRIDTFVELHAVEPGGRRVGAVTPIPLETWIAVSYALTAIQGDPLE